MINKINNSTREKESRRGTYPCIPLNRCIVVAKIILNLGGDREVIHPEMLAGQLKVATKSSILPRVWGGCRCFGLIEPRGIKLTALAMEYFHPTDEEQRRGAMLEIITKPKTFETLISRFDGNQLPSTEILKNVLRREYKIAPSWISRVVTLFLSSIEFADLVDEDNFLRYGAARHTVKNSSVAPHEAPMMPVKAIGAQHEPASPPVPVGPIVSAEGSHTHTLFLNKNKSRQFAFTGPVEITQKEFARIRNWLEFTMIIEEGKEPE